MAKVVTRGCENSMAGDTAKMGLGTNEISINCFSQEAGGEQLGTKKGSLGR